MGATIENDEPGSEELDKREAPDLAVLIQISRRCGALPDLDTRIADEILGYDETGTFR